MTTSDYNPGPATQRWAEKGLEQKASVVNQWFARHSKGWTDLTDLRRKLESPEATRAPYFRFIRDNIKAGQD